MRRNIKHRIIFLTILSFFFCSSCELKGIGAVSFKPTLIPVTISLDSNSNLNISFDAISIPTSLGTISVDLGLNTPVLEGKKLLAIRMNGQDTIYDLKEGEVTEITFVPGFYTAVRLHKKDDDLIVELVGTNMLNADPLSKIANEANIPVRIGRRSCSESAVTTGMKGIVVSPVSLRSDTYIPEDYLSNRIGVLQTGEILTILEVNCKGKSEGVWLKVRRDTAGDGETEGWAKEWGLTNDLQELTLIVPLK